MLRKAFPFILLIFILSIPTHALAGKQLFFLVDTSPFEGEDSVDIQFDKMLILNPSRFPNTSVKLGASLDLLEDAIDKPIKNAKLLVNTTSAKRLKIDIECFNTKTDETTTLFSEILPQGLTLSKPYKLTRLQDHVFKNNLDYYIVIEFLDGAANNDSNNRLGIVAVQLKWVG